MKRVSSDAEEPRKPRRSKKQPSAPLAPPLGELPSAHTGLRGPSPGAYENREKVMKRVSSDAESSEVQLPAAEEKLVKRSSGSHAAAAPAKRTKRKGGAHCAK